MATVLAERVQELRSDRGHGASWMARRAVETLVELAHEEARTSEELLARLVFAGRDLAESRPGVGAVEGAVGRLLAAAHRHHHLPLDDFRSLVTEEARSLTDARRRAAASIAIQLRERLHEGYVLTHSASATVREALVHSPPEAVVCTVSSPLEEGRAFADELRAAGLNVELVEDDDAVAELAHATLLLVGADTVYRDATLCNKIGTRALAEAAAQAGVPTVVASEVIKLAPFAPSEAPELPPAVRGLFDLTPPELIDEIVTEEGVHRPDDIPALVDRTPFLREGYELLHVSTRHPAP